MKFGMYRGNILADRVIFKSLKDANAYKEKANADFAEFRKATGKPMQDYEVREFKVSRKSAMKKLSAMME